MDRRPTALSRALRFLHKEFEPAFCYWETVVLIERLVLTGFLLLIPNDRQPLRLVAALLFTMLTGCITSLLMPYRRKAHDFLSVITHVLLQILFLCALLVKLHGDISRELGTFAAGVILAFSDATHVVTLMVAFTVFMLGIIVVVLMRSISEQASLPILRYKNGFIPELSISDDAQFHLFISHVWKTGLDQSTVMKRMLCSMLVDARIFLEYDAHDSNPSTRIDSS